MGSVIRSLALLQDHETMDIISLEGLELGQQSPGLILNKTNIGTMSLKDEVGTSQAEHLQCSHWETCINVLPMGQIVRCGDAEGLATDLE